MGARPRLAQQHHPRPRAVIIHALLQPQATALSRRRPTTHQPRPPGPRAGQLAQELVRWPSRPRGTDGFRRAGEAATNLRRDQPLRPRPVITSTRRLHGALGGTGGRCVGRSGPCFGGDPWDEEAAIRGPPGRQKGGVLACPVLLLPGTPYDDPEDRFAADRLQQGNPRPRAGGPRSPLRSGGSSSVAALSRRRGARRLLACLQSAYADASLSRWSGCF
jgi:hypothetical protein